MATIVAITISKTATITMASDVACTCTISECSILPQSSGIVSTLNGFLSFFLSYKNQDREEEKIDR